MDDIWTWVQFNKHLDFWSKWMLANTCKNLFNLYQQNLKSIYPKSKIVIGRADKIYILWKGVVYTKKKNQLIPYFDQEYVIDLNNIYILTAYGNLYNLAEKIKIANNVKKIGEIGSNYLTGNNELKVFKFVRPQVDDFSVSDNTIWIVKNKKITNFPHFDNLDVVEMDATTQSILFKSDGDYSWYHFDGNMLRSISIRQKYFRQWRTKLGIFTIEGNDLSLDQKINGILNDIIFRLSSPVKNIIGTGYQIIIQTEKDYYRLGQDLKPEILELNPKPLEVCADNSTFLICWPDKISLLTLT